MSDKFGNGYPRIKNPYTFEYFVNEEKGTVTCNAIVATGDVDNELYIMIRNYRLITGRDYVKGYREYTKSITQTHTPLVFTGVARLKTNDVNDIDFAKKIARAKALRQANKIISDIIDVCADMLFAENQRLMTYSIGTSLKAEEYDREISDLLS
jgi:hypothetical protein